MNPAGYALRSGRASGNIAERRTRYRDHIRKRVVSVTPADGTGSHAGLRAPCRAAGITCTVRTAASAPRVVWKIAIRNHGPFGVRSLFYPQWPAPLRLAGGRQDRLLYPFLDGQEFVDPGDHMPVGRVYRIIYPGQSALQLMAYHDATSGLLEMT